MPKIIEIGDLSSTYNLQLDGEDLTMRLYYSLTADRWIMDLTNNRLETTVKGVVINTGTDLLSGAGHLGLQALVALSFPDPSHEATIENFSTNVKMIYLTLQEYNDFRFGGLGHIRTQWIQDRVLTVEDINNIVEPPPTTLDPLLFVKKASPYIESNLLEFDLNGNAADSGSSIQDLLDLVANSNVDGEAIAIEMALSLGG